MTTLRCSYEHRIKGQHRNADHRLIDDSCKNLSCPGDGTVIPTGGSGAMSTGAPPQVLEATGICDKCRCVHRQGESSWYLPYGDVDISEEP